MKLYYENSYMASFKAKVIECFQEDKAYAAVLDQTAFYPEGGGQPSDIGWLGDAKVLDVYECKGQIIHVIDKPVELGIQIEGRIDWKHRFSLMQNHTGEHIVSGIIKEKYGYDNIGFHMGRDAITIDINGELKEEALREIEKLANEAIYNNIAIGVRTYSKEELSGISYRSKKELESDVRIVSIIGYDACACCGLHCAYTGEIGLVKLLTAHKYKSGTRIYMLCGARAVEDYTLKNKSAYTISTLLSAKPNEITEAVQKMLEENGITKQQLAISRKELLQLKAERIAESKSVCVIEEGLTPVDLRNYCLFICERAELAAVFTKDTAGGYKYAIGSKACDVRNICKEINKEFNGRGGGQKEIVQGFIKATEEDIKSFIQQYEF